MPFVTVGHPIVGFSGYVRVGDIGLGFVGGVTGRIDLSTGDQTKLTGLGFVLNPATPVYESPYLLDTDLLDGNGKVLDNKLPTRLGDTQLRAASVAAVNASGEHAPGEASLPVLSILTEGAAPVVSKDDYLHIALSIDGVATTGRIKGRGNSTWAAPKRPYKLKLDYAATPLGLPSSKDFVLLAGYYDPSFLRNAVFFELGARCTGLPWTSRTSFAELQLNGQYLGLYQIAQGVQFGADRVNATAATGTTGLPLTGAYLLEIDDGRGAAAGDPAFATSRGVHVLYDDPDGTVPQQAAYISSWFQTFEDALYGSNWLDPTLGYAKYIDRNSFIDWYLVNELVANQDSGFSSSCKLYKTRDTADTPGKLFMGPLWDADLSLGTAIIWDGTTHSPTEWWTRNGATYLARMLADPDFLLALKQRWATLYANIKSSSTGISVFMDKTMALLAEARKRDQSVWTGTKGDFGSVVYQTGSDWYTSLGALKTWLNTRIDWMNTQLGGVTPPPTPAVSWRADSITGVADGATVAAWPATAGGAAMQATTGELPTLLASAVNAKPAVHFAGAQSMHVDSLAAQGQPFTISTVVRATTPTASAELAWWGYLFEFYIEGTGANTGKWAIYSNGAQVYGTTATANQWVILTVSFDGTTCHFYVNGTLVGTLAAPDAATGAQLILGKHVANGRYFTGDVAEISRFNSALTTGERSALHSAAQTRYGITVADFVG